MTFPISSVFSKSLFLQTFFLDSGRYACFFHVCDELEAGLLYSQADSKRLMEAVVGRMLAAE
ncbi:MAG: hypothetical protein O8C63_11285 [Candidatus Methanoperedens sp.]|nr:hypothetical protein [Candidatus Methanoperedens sp.]